MSEPYLRPQPPEGVPSAPCPPGQLVEAAGVWGGEVMEVVYDPRHHDVVFVRGEVSAKIQSGLVDTGWEHRLTDGANQMWVRDRRALAHRRLQRAQPTHTVPRIA